MPPHSCAVIIIACQVVSRQCGALEAIGRSIEFWIEPLCAYFAQYVGQTSNRSAAVALVWERLRTAKQTCVLFP